jgi:hypothetical protein
VLIGERFGLQALTTSGASGGPPVALTNAVELIVLD